MNLTVDCIFSNWILIWSIIYFFKIIKIPTPFYFIIIAIILNFVESIYYLLRNGLKLSHLLIFWTIIFITKIYPAYLIGKPKNLDGLYFGLVLFIIYVCYATTKHGIQFFPKFIEKTKKGFGPITSSVIKTFEKYT
jgi:hypothetical protein